MVPALKMKRGNASLCVSTDLSPMINDGGSLEPGLVVNCNKSRAYASADFSTTRSGIADSPREERQFIPSNAERLILCGCRTRFRRRFRWPAVRRLCVLRLIH